MWVVREGEPGAEFCVFSAYKIAPEKRKDGYYRPSTLYMARGCFEKHFPALKLGKEEGPVEVKVTMERSVGGNKCT